MPEDEEQGPPSGSSYEAYALYNEVRQEIFRELMTCLRQLRVIIGYESEGSEKGAENTEEFHSLRAEVVSVLYPLIKDKLEYPKYNKSFKKLEELEPYLIGEKSVKTLRLPALRVYISLIRAFIEADGITKFEREQDNLPPEFIMAHKADGVIHGPPKAAAPKHE